MLPEPYRQRKPARSERRLEKIRNEADFTIESRSEVAWVEAELDRLDSETIGAALGYAHGTEEKLYRKGMASAGDSAILRELLLRKLELLSDKNLRRIDRRFR